MRTKRVKELSYLGPIGTFSEAAAAEARKVLHAGDANLCAANGIPATAVRANSDGIAAVLPYYNLLEGVVQESLDGIARNELSIVGLIRLPIVFWAGCSAETADVEVIKSHPKALGQSSEFISTQYPEAKIIPTSSTASAAEAAKKEPGSLAIASRKAIEEADLVVVSEDAGNRRYGKQNFTDFLIVANDADVANSSASKWQHTLLLIAPETDEPGLLAGILNNLAWQGLSLAKLHSRPSPVGSEHGEGEPQAFYIEINCNPADPRLLRAVDAIEGRFRNVESATVRILGGFDIHQA